LIFKILFLHNLPFHKAPPKITPFSFGEEPANVEDSVSVTCLISTGDLPIDIEWFFNDYGISSYSGISVMKGGKRNSVLSIDSVQARHAGNYSCRAKNHAAAVNYTTVLIVNGTTVFRFTNYINVRFSLLIPYSI